MTRRAASGTGTRFEVNAARMALARARVEAESASRDAAALAAELGSILGETPSEAPADSPIPVLPPLDEVLARGLASRGRIRATRAGVAEAEARAREARGAGASDLTVGGFARYEGEEVALGLSLTWGASTSSRTTDEVAAREAEVDVSERLASEVEQELRRELIRAWHVAMGRRARSEPLQREVEPLLDESAELVAVGVARGTATAVELLAMLRERRELAASRVEADGAARVAATLVLAAIGVY